MRGDCGDPTRRRPLLEKLGGLVYVNAAVSRQISCPRYATPAFPTTPVIDDIDKARANCRWATVGALKYSNAQS